MTKAGTNSKTNFLPCTSVAQTMRRRLAIKDRWAEKTDPPAYVPALLRTRNVRMAGVLKAAKLAAATSASVLLLGEIGVGKRLLARQIHDWSPNHHLPFVEVDCANILQSVPKTDAPEVLARLITGKASSGAGDQHSVGAGTVFLDNIADLDIEAQAKLSALVDAKRLGIGSGLFAEQSARIVAASTRDLGSEVLAKRFRADLFYRINMVSLRMPPLRERPEDILPLAESVLRNETIRLGRRNAQFSAGVRFAIQHRPWFGNALELSSMVEGAAILSANDLIAVADIPALNRWYSPENAPSIADPPARTLRDVEKGYIADILASGLTATKAADALGISLSTLRRKRTLYNLV
jgi:DNA-binding NtrC family response regulator